jgi:tetratricopeptide (TPR) repeat protein
MISGNFYSLRQEREKAVQYFLIATQLNKHSSLPYTLMGHEYLEMKNQQAAIEAYRHAIGKKRILAQPEAFFKMKNQIRHQRQRVPSLVRSRQHLRSDASLPLLHLLLPKSRHAPSTRPSVLVCLGKLLR